jgi:hypothetical protein
MMKDIIIAVLLGIILSMIFLNSPKEQGRWYDCGMAEWHPDIPQQVKEECRKMRSGKIT